MEKRAFERIPANLEFHCFNMDYFGTVTNLSEKGMCINMRIPLHINSSDELIITFKEEGLRPPAKVKRIEMAYSLSDTIVVEVLNLSKEYLEFVDSLRPV